MPRTSTTRKSARSKNRVASRLVALPDLSKQRKPAKRPKVKAITVSKLTSIVSKLWDRKTTFAGPPLLQLSARHPYDPAGLMDVYAPGRWDCSSDLVFMDVIRSTGPSRGEWDGTVCYVQFTAPDDGTYAVVGNFSGYQITLALNGPWGNNTAYNATTSSSSAAVALWPATSGQALSFTVNCTGPIIGYLQSIQIFKVS